MNLYRAFCGLYKKVEKLYMLYVKRDKFQIAVKKWFKENGDNTLRIQYDLNENSVVFDVGGYLGDFSDKIFKKYHCYVYVFELTTKYYKIIRDRFANKSKIKVFNYGLGYKNDCLEINVQSNGSSIYRKKNSNVFDRIETVKINDIFKVITSLRIDHIDLIKINIEGGEYGLLERMIQKKIHLICENIQIQFHQFFKDSERLRENLRKKLSLTHKVTYDYYFVFENWKKLR